MSEDRVISLSDEYRRPIRVALYQQVVIAIFCLLLLDGGGMAKLCGIVMLGFWSGVALVIVRRPRTPTATDKALIQYAFLPLFAVSVVTSMVSGMLP